MPRAQPACDFHLHPDFASGRPFQGQHIEQRLWDPLAIQPDRAELLRFLGYGRVEDPSRRLPSVVETALGLGESVVRPRGIAAAYPIEQRRPNEIVIGGSCIRGALGRFLEPAQQVAVFVVTVGGEITRLSEEAARGGDIVTAWALDAFGSYAVEAAAEAVAHAFEDRNSATPRYSPGYCGICLETQRDLFALLDTESIGVSLLPSMFMRPTKSISGVFGLGPLGLFSRDQSACSRCAAQRCPMRR